MLKACGAILFVTLCLPAAPYFAQQSNAAPSQHPAAAPSSQAAVAKPHALKLVMFANKEYGFHFSLPESWKGYSVLTLEWTGEVYDKDGTRLPNDEHGPKLLIRHPLWTKEKPYEDIPIMIFTRAQWSLIEGDRMEVSAAPIGPEDIGRNAKYVFALPPRYLNDDAIGSDEVLAIMRGNPFHAIVPRP